MAEDIRVLIVEDDPFALNWMELILRRDWRTRVVEVVGNAHTLVDALTKLKEKNERIDLVLLDTDIPGDSNWLKDVLKALQEYSPSTAVLFTGVSPNRRIVPQLSKVKVAGYILKEEIRFALAWAIALTARHNMVITPGVQSLLYKEDFDIPGNTLVLDGRNEITNMTKHNSDVARMAILFSMERRELADELKMREGSMFGLVSNIYKQIGMDELLSGEIDPAAYVSNNPTIIKHINEIIEDLKASSKAKDKETLAFHMLTMPEVHEVIN